MDQDPLSSGANSSVQQPNASRPNSSSFAAPVVSLPKGGGAIQGIGEKFAVNPANGTASFEIPIFTSQSRSGFYPKLSLKYDSGSGNGPFGFGWAPFPSFDYPQNGQGPSPIFRRRTVRRLHTVRRGGFGSEAYSVCAEHRCADWNMDARQLSGHVAGAE